MLHIGLNLLGRYAVGNQRTNERRFRGAFGVGPEAVAKVFHDLRTTDIQAARVPRANPKNLLWSLKWMKGYATEELKGSTKDEKTQRANDWKYAKAIRGLKGLKVRINVCLLLAALFLTLTATYCFAYDKIVWRNDDVIVVCSVDGIHCPINEPRMDPGSKWYSHKSNGAGLAYEVALSLQTSHIVHIAGGVPCATSDLMIFRSDEGLRNKLADGQRAIADEGYKNDEKCMTRNFGDTQQTKKYKKRAKARQETINARIKSFRCMKEHFRHKPHKHPILFEAICCLIQYDMENGHPLFAV